MQKATEWRRSKQANVQSLRHYGMHHRRQTVRRRQRRANVKGPRRYGMCTRPKGAVWAVRPASRLPNMEVAGTQHPEDECRAQKAREREAGAKRPPQAL